MQYYYLGSDGQTVLGPFSKDDIRTMWVTKRLTGSSLCAREGAGSEDWRPLNQMLDEIYSAGDRDDELSSMGRAGDPDLQLILRTRESQEVAARYTEEQSTRIARNMFPCWELIRVGVPDLADEERDWPTRWSAAGGSFYEGRMIALKGAQVWVQLGSYKLFSDALGTEYPPYAYGSQMTRRAVSRQTCVELGIPIPPLERDKSKPALSPEMRALAMELKRDLEASLEAGSKRADENPRSGCT